MPRKKRPVARPRDLVVRFYLDIGEAGFSMKRDQRVRIVNAKTVFGAVEGAACCSDAIHASDDAEAVGS
jgi:hypothetical protein